VALSPQQDQQLAAVLREARRLGFLGPGPVIDHIERSMAFVRGWEAHRDGPPATVLDMGSGGGVPGLVLAMAWPSSRVLLLDGSERRVAFLHDALAELGLSARVSAWAQRAEDAGRTALRHGWALVTARGFAAPAVTAECGGAFLDGGGLLAVAEPPGGEPARWPPSSLSQLGLTVGALVVEPAAVQMLERTGPFPGRYPRRVGIPAKRPLW
jgi:16S rRNA (guanine527-N7)-methyltransferase